MEGDNQRSENTVGALDNARLTAMLAEFTPDRIPVSISEIYRGRAHADVLEVIADVTVKMFLRVLQTTIRLTTCHDSLGLNLGRNFTIYQRFKGDVNAVVGLEVSNLILKQIATVLLGTEVKVVDADTIDAAAEFLNILCGNVSARLSALGHNSELEPPKVHAWSTGPLDLTTMIAGTSLTGTPLLHPTEAIELVVIV